MTQSSDVPESLWTLIYLIVQSNGNTLRAGALLVITLGPIAIAIILAGPVATMSTITGLSSLLGAAGLMHKRRK